MSRGKKEEMHLNVGERQCHSDSALFTVVCSC